MRAWIGLAAALALAACGSVDGSGAGDDIDAGEPRVACTTDLDCPGDQPICDDTDGLCRACTASSDCTGKLGTEECHVDTGQCVACTESSQCTVSSSNICDAETFRCRGCQEHSECDSEFCDKDRSTCVPVDDVIYVDGTAPALPDCGSLIRKCSTLQAAMAATSFDGTRSYIRVLPMMGGYSPDVNLQHNIYVLAEGVTFTISKTDEPTIRLYSNGNTEPTIWEGGTFDGVNRLNDTQAPIACNGLSKLHIFGATFKNLQRAINLNYVSSGSHLCGIRVFDSVFEDNQDVVTSSYPDASMPPQLSGVQIERSVFRNNLMSVVSGSALRIRLENNLFVENGTAYAGIIDIFDGELDFLYNTMATNLTNTESAFQCGGSTGTISGNILWGLHQESGVFSCGQMTITDNIVQPTDWEPTPPEGNSTDAPKFVNPTDGDYRLAPDSPGIDVGNVLYAPSLDFDGKARPLGNGPDLGAFERAP